MILSTSSYVPNLKVNIGIINSSCDKYIVLGESFFDGSNKEMKNLSDGEFVRVR